MFTKLVSNDVRHYRVYITGISVLHRHPLWATFVVLVVEKESNGQMERIWVRKREAIDTPHDRCEPCRSRFSLHKQVCRLELPPFLRLRQELCSARCCLAVRPE